MDNVNQRISACAVVADYPSVSSFAGQESEFPPTGPTFHSLQTWCF